MIDSLDALQALYPEVSERARAKQIDHLNAAMVRLIGHAPLCVLASSGANGGLPDASPRGGAPGFVQVVNERCLLIPDAAGNNRLDTLRNLLVNPALGLLFLVPGVEQVLRVNGTVRLRDEPDFIQRFTGPAVRQPPRLVIEVAVQEAYLHCPKALMRARLWSAQAQVAPGTFGSINAMLREQLGNAVITETEAQMQTRYAAVLADEGLPMSEGP